MTDEDFDQTTEVITSSHGSGGAKMRELIQTLAVDRFDSAAGDGDGVGLADLDDGAVLPVGGEQSVVMTTDSHVVSPPVFPGGDVGRLAVAGTVNDLAMMGATDPLAMSVSLVVEEGVERAFLDEVMASVHDACAEADCPVVTGDTKVMGSGELDTLALNTTGLGLVTTGGHVPDAGLRPGDAVVVTGTLGDHGIALLSERAGFDFGGDLRSDVAPINRLVAAALDAGDVTAMKDPTRGGFSGAINEMATKADVGVELDESSIPVSGSVASAGEMLGIDPLDVANEGVAVLGVAEGDAADVVAALRDRPRGRDAAVVGRVTDDHPGRVVLDTGLGRRYLTEPTGEQLPRIC